LKKNRKGIHPPDLPVFHPFDGEPEKPTAPKPSHRLSIITEREQKASQTRSEELRVSEKSEKYGMISFGKAFVKGKTERGNSSGLPFTLGQRLSKARGRVEPQPQTEVKQFSYESSTSQDTKRVSFQTETKIVDPNESEKPQEEEKEEPRGDTLEATIAHLEQELLGTDGIQQNTNKDSKKDKIDSTSELPRDTVEVSEEAPTLGWIRAIFDYEAAAEDELPLQEGDIIRLLDMHESGWWTGELNGVIGLFPGNHVEVTSLQ